MDTQLSLEEDCTVPKTTNDDSSLSDTKRSKRQSRPKRTFPESDFRPREKYNKNKVKKKFNCQSCGLQFRDSHNLNSHMQSKRCKNRKEAYRCPECKKKYLNKTALRKHVGSHTQIKPLKCNICQDSFLLRCDLSDHKKIHSKQHQCE